MRAKHKDTVYLKCLMAAGYEQGFFNRGIFIPYGIQIKEGPGFLKNLLHKHNNYVKDIKCLVVKGISKVAIFSPAPLPENTEATISDHFCFAEHGM
eukprot:13176018-Ditylum_brightwellii.AAC.1